jgi:hypothetical protein
MERGSGAKMGPRVQEHEVWQEEDECREVDEGEYAARAQDWTLFACTVFQLAGQ